MDHHPDAYRLLRRPTPPASPPRLDAAQQAVVDHAGGPLLVLAGPGTGKTTAIVEAVAQRITERRIDPERVLVLTFSRKAAQELRERITTRLRRTTRQPLALTFHSYAYALVRREFVLAGDVPPTLLSGPEQLLEVRRMLRAEAAGAERWRELGASLVCAARRPSLAGAAAPGPGHPGFATELRDFLLRAAERGLDGRGLARLGRAHGREDWVAAGGFLDRYIARFDLAPVPAYDYAEIVRIAAALLSRAATRDRERKAYDVVLVDEYQDTDPAQEALLHALAGDGRELIAVGDPDQSIYAFRGADVHAMGRFPDLFRTPDDRPASVIALRTCRRSGPVLLAASRRVAARLPAAAGLSPSDGRPSPRRPAAPAAHRPRPWSPGPAPAGRRGAWRHPDPGRVQRQPGSRRHRRHPAPRAPGGRHSLVLHGRPGPLGDAPGSVAAPCSRDGRRPGGRGGRRAAARRGAGCAAAARAAALRAAAGRARRGRRRRAADRAAGRHRRGGPAAAAPLAARRRRRRRAPPGKPAAGQRAA